MCGDGRQPRILVDNFWIPRSQTRTFSTPGPHRAVLLLFFALVRAFAFFLVKAKTTLLVLRIFTSSISPHFAEFAGIKLKITRARQILTALFLKFAKSGEIYCCWILQMFIHSRFKKNQRKKANFNCKWSISLLMEHALIIRGKIKHCRYDRQAKKAPDAWSQH